MSENNQAATLEMAQNLGLSENEFQKICDVMGRKPNFTELSIYSVMWSEHCSYKNSIKYLKTLPKDGPRIMVEAGEENAGLVDIGDGWACAFKIESHNHPSCIEPYQGAATGVGGIHRDIFTMGARPIASLNSLRFGDIDRKHMKHLVEGVVKGIGDYGNCLGVPTVGGEVYFNKCYNQNILVNAMSVGILEGKTMSATAGTGSNPVFIVGSATGKDGIHGATFASADLGENSADDLPAVQVGDPFQEKLLLEASLEAIASDALIGMQDMGAAGISCSTSEMSAKTGAGMNINLDKVPTRQANMTAWEMLLSESQERMLIVVKDGQEQVILDIFDKWDLECEHIGETNESGILNFFQDNQLVAEVNAYSLVLGGGAPVYDRAYTKPGYQDKIEQFDVNEIDIPKDMIKAAEAVIGSCSIASKNWITEQYDSMVRTNSMGSTSPSDAAIIRIKGTNKALAATTDCNSTYVYADPYVGTMIAVTEAARNVVCSGAKPVAITNCLNFGNPYNPEVYWQFVNAIKGMGEACRKFKTPVTGGNVSFYNQSLIKGKTVPVYPTPTIGMLGIIEDHSNKMDLSFKKAGDHIIMLGAHQDGISSSEYVRIVHGVEFSPVPQFDLDQSFEQINHLEEIISQNLITSAHDVSDGGLFTTLVESCFMNKVGFDINIPKNKRMDGLLFGEDQSRIVISVSDNQIKKLKQYLVDNNVSHEILGQVNSGEININGVHFKNYTHWADIHSTSLTDKMTHDLY